MQKLFWVLVVLVVLLLGVDRAGDYAAEKTVADRLQASQNLRRTPEVDIAGFPFLTQVAHRRFEKVTIVTRGVPVEAADRTLTLSRLTFVLGDVRAEQGFTRFRATTNRARARASYAELSRALGLTVSYAGQGTVRAGKQITVAGQKIDPSLTVRPRIVDGSLAFDDASTGAGVPDAVIRQALQLRVPLTQLPFGARATSLTADPRGLVVRLVSRDRTFG